MRLVFAARRKNSFSGLPEARQAKDHKKERLYAAAQRENPFVSISIW